jgi:hypothetical protein
MICVQPGSDGATARREAVAQRAWMKLEGEVRDSMDQALHIFFLST